MIYINTKKKWLPIGFGGQWLYIYLFKYLPFKTKDATIQTKDIEIKDYKSTINNLQKEKEVNIHIISVLYERLSHISSSSIWDRLRNKTKQEANKTIDTIKPKIVELLNKGSEE
jgi:hypothetical protein